MFSRKQHLFVIVVILAAASIPVSCFVPSSQSRKLSFAQSLQIPQSYPLLVLGAEQEPEDGTVEVGSKEYLDGFLSSPIQDESVAERGSGLEQALKLGVSAAAILAALFVGFMASNGLI